MKVPIFRLDAFTARRFRGNPAAVMRFDTFPPDTVLQAIAAENNLSETAFLSGGDGEYRLRWFTPTVEVPLCGHATLASAAVVLERFEPARGAVAFQTASGPLFVRRTEAGFAMDFPGCPTEPVPVPAGLAAALGAEPAEVRVSPHNYLVVLDTEATVRSLEPDMGQIRQLQRVGVIVTAQGTGEYDLVSRYFTPARGVPEDPVTGSAHCALAPFWAQRLGKAELRAYQASPRGGEMVCRVRDPRVELEGACVFFCEGAAEI